MINSIKYLANKEIDKSKWDNVISQAPNGFIYCRSFFLDALCTWDALILGDYESIMPLPLKSKQGLHYVYTPFFIGQLGIISKNEISADIIEAFINSIPLKFKYVDLHLNESNRFTSQGNIQLQVRNNYVLSLKDPYHIIEKNYSKDGKKNLRQAEPHMLHAEENVDLTLVVKFFKEAYGNLNSGITDRNYNKLIQAGNEAISQDFGFTIAVKKPDGEVVATAFFGKDEKRIYYILGAPSSEGRIMNAQHVLINEVIKKFSGRDITFDFEGSDIPNVASFYKKFSPQLKNYYHITINRLPFWLKWLKA